MKIIQYEDKFIDLDKVSAFEVRQVKEAFELQIIDIYELVAIFDSGIGISLGKNKVKTVLVDWVAGQWKVPKKGMF